MRSMFGSVQSQPRAARGRPVARPIFEDVPLGMRRSLDGMGQQGIARTLSADEIEMPAECVRPGEIFISPGVCGAPPGATTVVSPGSRITTTTPSASAKGAAAGTGMSNTTLILIGAGALAAIYYLGKVK